MTEIKDYKAVTDEALNEITGLNGLVESLAAGATDMDGSVLLGDVACELRKLREAIRSGTAATISKAKAKAKAKAEIKHFRSYYNGPQNAGHTGCGIEFVTCHSSIATRSTAHNRDPHG